MITRISVAALPWLASCVAALAQPASPVDGQYAFKASVGNNFEIQSSRMALRSSSDAGVINFAQRMIADHEKAQAELDRAASVAGAESGPYLDAPHEAKLTTLSSLSGAAFDQAYLADQVEAHHETLQLLDDVSATGSDPSLRTWAAKTRPVVLNHLLMLGRMAASTSL